MPGPRRFDLDELAIRPGTYFNPSTEVLIVVDDSPDFDHEVFDHLEQDEGADWVLISDEAPVDEHARDELIERFQVRHHPSERATAGHLDDGDEDEDLDPDEDDLDAE